MAQPSPSRIVILDFGSQYTQVIARRVRECQVYSQILPFDTPAKEIAALKPNGLILSGARVYYAMAKDGLFFKSTGKLHPRYLTPRNALIVQGVWTCVLCLTGTYNDLLNYVIFAVLVFYILTIGGLFVLRRTKPEAERPYRAIGYPVLPAIYIVMALFIDVVLLRYKPQYTWPGLIIVLLGIPVYFVWSRRSAVAQA